MEAEGSEDEMTSDSDAPEDEDGQQAKAERSPKKVGRVERETTTKGRTHHIEIGVCTAAEAGQGKEATTRSISRAKKSPQRKHQ